MREGTGSGRPVVPVADGFRGLAMLAVMAYHVLAVTGAPLPGAHAISDVVLGGYLGVDIFFVLSGFLLFLPVAAAGGAFGDLKSYALRRGARILPAYYLALFATLALVPWLTSLHTGLSLASVRGWGSLLLHMTFLQHVLGPSLGWQEGFAVNGVVWSLAIEAVFYVALPLVAARYCRRPFAGLGLALVIAAAWRYAAFHLLPHPAAASTALWVVDPFGPQFPAYVAHFGAGMTAAWVFVTVKDRRLPVPGPIIVAAQAVSASFVLWQLQLAGHRSVMQTVGPIDHWSRTTPVALGFALLLLTTALAPPWAQRPFRNRAARHLGDLSYGMYLWHLVALRFALITLGFSRAPTLGSVVALGAFVFACSYVVATASYRLLEQPVLRWARGRALPGVASARGLEGA